MAYGIFLDRGLNLCPLRWQLDSQPLGHQGSPDISTQSATIPFALGMRLCVCAVVSRVQLFATLWTVARQAPLSMGFSKQEYWSGLPFSSLGDLPDPGIKPTSSVSPALAGGFFTTSTTWEALLTQETRVQSLTWEDPTCRGATKPMHATTI